MYLCRQQFVNIKKITKYRYITKYVLIKSIAILINKTIKNVRENLKFTLKIFKNHEYQIRI